MKTLVLFCSILLLSTATFAQVEPVPPVPEPEPVRVEKQSEILTITEVPAEFPGGQEAMTAFFATNMHYPATALEQGLEGKCYVKFVIDNAGSIRDIQVVRGVSGCRECDREAVRLISIMPKWTPATDNGRNVACYYNLPVIFKID